MAKNTFEAELTFKKNVKYVSSKYAFFLSRVDINLYLNGLYINCENFFCFLND